MVAANKYGKFYRIKTEEADPELARFFFGIYKVVSPAQTLLQHALQSTQLKLATVNNFLNPRQLDILAQVSPESIDERATNIPPRDLARQIQTEFDTLAGSFDTELKGRINECYNLILTLIKFVSFDFYFFLKKFDSHLRERNFSYNPQFIPVQGRLISDELKDFLELTGTLDPNLDWNSALMALKAFKDTDVVNPKLWNSLLLQLRDIKRSGILEMMIRFIDKNPDWSWVPSVHNEDITGAYLEIIKTEMFDHLKKIITVTQNTQITEYAQAVFGYTNVNNLKNYTDRAGEMYVKKGFPGFRFSQGLNYLSAFLLEEKMEFLGLYDLILVRAQWVTPALSLPLSESVRTLIPYHDRINELDDSLANGGVYSNRLKTAMIKIDRDKNQTKIISANLDTVNGEAKTIINEAIFHLSVLHDGFTDTLEDCRKNDPTVILNWEELNTFSVLPMESQLQSIVTRLTNILQLLRLIVQASDELI
ncbi:conserved hypothetical protein [Treponema primitia ZAS-2]|uniref:Uncharacterized protein n=2 Tax=Treponema primitia TaxID=88058 RepID=F5YMS0_TREPZ|nr:conserved hypothetical protein [Treponema primitia ZAS-2]